MSNKSVILDTSIASKNIGDEIIMDAVNQETFSALKANRFFRLPTHESISRTGLSIIRNADFSIVGGSNILSSYMNKYPQWKINILQSYFIKNKIIFLGVGWRQYEKNANFYTKKMLNLLSNKTYLHSVRDGYTEDRLKSIGINNVLNTACPTMWGLTKEHCEIIPIEKAKNVVFTLTDYNKDPKADQIMIDTLLKNYHQVSFWIQSIKDETYFNELIGDQQKRIQIIPPNLQSYDNYLDNNETDYVGTRLHGGIRALQKGKRTIIIGIDNRAKEKQKDFNLKVVSRDEIQNLKQAVNQSFETNINIPIEKISQWKNQFK